MKRKSGRFQAELESRPSWSLKAAYTLAQSLINRPDQAAARRELIYALFHSQGEIRKRAADITRRISYERREWLYPAAAQLSAILADVPVEESRTRWHLGLAVARSARTRDQIATAAELLWALSQDKSNVVRCTAVEGLGELALRSAAVREHAEPFLFKSARNGSAAMRCRARTALRRLGFCIGT